MLIVQVGALFASMGESHLLKAAIDLSTSHLQSCILQLVSTFGRMTWNILDGYTALCTIQMSKHI